MNAAVIGAGGWGTTLARILDERGHHVTLWARREEFALELSRIRENRTYLPGISLSSSIDVTHNAHKLAHNDLYVFALPTQATREVAAELSPQIAHGKAIYVSASKGVERGTMARVTEILQESLGVDPARTVTLS